MSSTADPPCPVCGSSWKVAIKWPKGTAHGNRKTSRWWVEENSGGRTNRNCSMTEEQRTEFRRFRREAGIDPTE